MANLCGPDGISIKSEGGIDELDYVPLTQRRKSFRSTKSTPHVEVFMKQEDEHCNSQGVLSSPSACSARVGDLLLVEAQCCDSKDLVGVTPEDPCSRILVESAIDQSLQSGTCGKCVGMPGDCNCNGTQVNTYACSEQITCSGVNTDVSGQEKVDVNVCTLPQNQTLSLVPAEVKAEHSDNLLSSLDDGINGFAGADVSAGEVKNEIPSNFAEDNLDHIPLKERQRMLLSRKPLGLATPVLKVRSGELLENLMQPCTEKGKEEAHFVDGESLVAKNQLYGIPDKNASVLCTHESTKLGGDMEVHANDRICSSESNACEGQDYVPASTNSLHTSTLSALVSVKVEPRDETNVNNLDRTVMCNFSFNVLPVKSEAKVPDELYGDEVDHMCLRDRMKMPTLGEDSNLNTYRDFECLKRSVPSALGCSPIAVESAKPVLINRPRKRRKTATDSVETALEEDAPGLLKVLTDKGITVDEIRLYGEMESDEALDESFSEDSFSELEAVISKLFIQRDSILKFAPIRCAKGARASYCLACLLSLVEQTRYIQFRKWPVEWGWCRDLQSFIFVFKRHNRIVLERPEYGYATYFFELVDSLPIEWQVKRLVTAMKLSSCGRASLIENKALLVGEDLSEGEAQVLMEYGWHPNSGLGTMLNYRDRVVHDRKNEKDTSEWRSKIGKLLMDGYNGGTMVAIDIPKKVEKYIGAESPEIKLELSN